MPRRFLCPRHALWLEQNPENIDAVWSNGMDTAQQHLSRQDWSAALPHLGCAYEAAGLMANHPARTSDRWLKRETLSRTMLHMALDKMGHRSQLETLH